MCVAPKRRLTKGEIIRYYDEKVFLPALRNLESKIYELVGEFEKEHNCVISVEHHKTIERGNSKALYFLSHSRMWTSPYNLGLQLMGLNPQDYPPAQTG